MGYPAIVAERHGFAWTSVRDVRPGDEQFLCGRWLTVERVDHRGARVVLAYTDGDVREWSGRQEVGIRREVADGTT